MVIANPMIAGWTGAQYFDVSTLSIHTQIAVLNLSNISACVGVAFLDDSRAELASTSREVGAGAVMLVDTASGGGLAGTADKTGSVTVDSSNGGANLLPVGWFYFGSQPMAGLAWAPSGSAPLRCGLVMEDDFESGGTLAWDQACSGDSCSSGWPAEGDLLITEIMQNPAMVDDTLGEWFEVRNLTSETLQLRGCTIASEGEPGHEIGAFTIPPSGITVFGINADSGSNGELQVDYEYGEIELGNDADSLEIGCGGELLDRVAWDNGATFPDPDGAAMQLDPVIDDPGLNDLGPNWCLANLVYGIGDLGTPSLLNTTCDARQWTVEVCLLAAPEAISAPEGSIATIWGRVTVPGLSDQTPFTDPDPLLLAELGFGPDGSHPESAGTWLFFDAIPNPDWDGAAVGMPEMDEYLIDMTLPSELGQPYDYAFRFSGDGGESWTFCDLSGSGDGYQIENAGHMEVF